MLLSCCDKCKGLFPSRDIFLDHDTRCEGNPYLSCCSMFACGRDDFLRYLTQQSCTESVIVNNEVPDLTASVNDKTFFCEEEFHFNTHKVYKHSGSMSDYGSCDNISSIPRHSISATDFGSCENIGSLRSGKFVRDDLALLHSFSPTFTKDDPDFFFNSTYMNYGSEEVEKATNSCSGGKNVDDLSKQFQLISNNLNTEGDKHKMNSTFTLREVDNFFTSLDQREINIQNSSDETHADHLNEVVDNSIGQFEDQNFVPAQCPNFQTTHSNNDNETLAPPLISLPTLERHFPECNSNTIQLATHRSETNNVKIDQAAYSQGNGTSIPQLTVDQCLLSITLSAGQEQSKKLEIESPFVTVSDTDLNREPVVDRLNITATDNASITQSEDNFSQSKDDLEPSENAGEIIDSYDTIQRNGRSMFKCKLCGKESAHLGFLKRHLSSHNNGKEHKCPHCSFTCLMKSRFKRHLISHKKPFLCNICAEFFSDATSLNRHLANHAGEPLYKCEHCDYTTNFKVGLEEHRRKHTGNYMICDYSGCSFKTAYRRALRMHIKKHNSVKQFICDICGYSTPESGSFKIHSRIHADMKLFKCSKCDFRAISRHAVVRHCKSKHLKEKGFACNVCDYKSSHTSDLRIHLMNHAGINPFQCTKCEYCSVTRSKILRHIKRKHARDSNASVKYNNIKFEINLDDYRIATNSVPPDIHVIELTEEQLKQDRKVKDKLKECEKVDMHMAVPPILNNPLAKRIDVDIGLEIDPPFDPDFGESSLQNLIVAFQCSKCLHLFKSEEELNSHTENCDSLSLGKAEGSVEGSPFSYLLGPDDGSI